MDFEAFQGLWETRVAKRIELMKNMDEEDERLATNFVSNQINEILERRHNTIFDKIEKDFGIKIAEEDRKVQHKDKYKLPYRVRMLLANDMKKEMKQYLTKNP